MTIVAKETIIKNYPAFRRRTETERSRKDGERHEKAYLGHGPGGGAGLVAGAGFGGRKPARGGRCSVDYC